MSGKPSDKAKELDPRKAIAKSSFYDIDGNLISSMNDVIPSSSRALVIFLRSFGWPFCQEQILQYSKRRNDLLAHEKNIQLVIVSIGKPEVGKQVCQHLGLNYEDAKSYIFCDPENALYDDLYLNRGIQTFIAPDTAFSFRDRIFNQQKTGLNDLFSVLSNWKDAIYIPPKAEQAFNQGGAFLFDGPNTIFAHYDASTGAHIDVNEMIQLSLSTNFSGN